MKFLMIFFMLSLLVQPVPVEACDMENDQDMSHHAAMIDTEKPECCESDSSTSDHSCSDALSCNTCPNGLALSMTTQGGYSPGLVRVYSVLIDHGLFDQLPRPPFRPPIS